MANPTYFASGSGDFGRKRGQRSTGWGAYFCGSSGQRMNVDVFVRTYFGGAAQRWQRLVGKGRGDGGVSSMFPLPTPVPRADVKREHQGHTS